MHGVARGSILDTGQRTMVKTTSAATRMIVLAGHRWDRRILTIFFGMYADGQEDLDADEFESWAGESLDDEEEEEQEEILDNIPWEEEERYRQMGMAHALDGLPTMFGPPPIIGGMHGMQVFGDFRDDEEEGGIAMIEEASDNEEEDGYESSFIDDDGIAVGGPRIREAIDVSDSEGDDSGAVEHALVDASWPEKGGR